MKKSDKQKLDRLPMEWLEILKEKNVRKYTDEVIGEMYIDTLQLTIDKKMSENRDEFRLLLFDYTSKYSYLIFHLEKHERYEECAEINKHFLAMASVIFDVTREYVTKLVNESITLFREN